MIKEEIGSITIISGIKKVKAGRKSICRVCGGQMLPHERAINIHKVGEMPSEFHAGCAYKLAEVIMRVINP